MGTKMQSAGYYSMRDLNEGSDGCYWSMYNGDKALKNGHCYNGLLPRAGADAYATDYKDAVKRKMLEHEATFKNQVHELHRLYGVQRDMMEEIKTTETKVTSCPLSSQITSEDARKWQIFNSPIKNSACATTYTSYHSPLNILNRNSAQARQFSSPNGDSSNDCEILNYTPTKARRTFDLRLPAENYIAADEFYVENGMETNCRDTSTYHLLSKNTLGLTDLNEPVRLEEAHAFTYGDHVNLQRQVPNKFATTALLGKNNVIPNNLDLKNNGREFSRHLITGHGNGNLNSSICSSQKSVSVQKHLYLNSSATVSKNSELSSQGHANYLERWHHTSNSSSLLSNTYSKQTNQERAFSDNSPNEVVLHSGVESLDGVRKHEDQFAVFPWLKASSCKDELTVSAIDLTNWKSGHFKSSNAGDAGRMETVESTSYRTIPSFSIVGRPQISEMDQSSLPPKHVSAPQQFEREVKDCRKNIIIDINLPCDDTLSESGEQIVEDTKVSSLRQFDLNSSISEEDEDSISFTTGIDLEALPLEEKAETPSDELIRTAVEAIISISSLQAPAPHDFTCNATHDPSESSAEEPLQWFASMVSSFGGNPKRKPDAYSSSHEIDYFESMTLKLIETKEEDYTPKPFVTSLPNRQRKGQGRKSRKRRDFQRAVLPGLASLSRQEVTEDLKKFGGLMRATGHLWQVGSTRRKRSVNNQQPIQQQLKKTDIVEGEDRNVTKWGRITRRPRQQRCHVGGNSQLLVLT